MYLIKICSNVGYFEKQSILSRETYKFTISLLEHFNMTFQFILCGNLRPLENVNL